VKGETFSGPFRQRHLLNTDLFAVAGLYEWWRGKDGAEPIESYTIITTDYERDYDAWLDPKNENTEALKALLKPYPAEEMRACPISTRVNNVNNEDERLIEELA
jgi:putative SOS response-associated peptidase YedK